MSYIGFGDTDREYYNESLNHAETMQLLAVAYYQAWYKSNAETNYLSRAKHFAEEAYKLFSYQLGKASRTLNAYLIKEYILRVSDKSESYQPSENDIVQFVGNEPTIDTAIEPLGVIVATEDFNSIKNNLANNLIDSNLAISLFLKLDKSNKEL